MDISDNICSYSANNYTSKSILHDFVVYYKIVCTAIIWCVP